MQKMTLCPGCADLMRGANYVVNEEGPTEKRTACFWCKHKGWFSVYGVRKEARKEAAK